MLTLCGAFPALAQQEALAGLGLRGSGALPDVTRVVVVLLAMIALAAGAALMLRRYWPRAAHQASAAVRVRGQVSLGSSLKLHFVELGSATVVVAEGRSGIAIAELRQAAAPTRGPANAE